MRDKIAQKLREIDQLTMIELGAKVVLPWNACSVECRAFYYEKADQILTLIKEKIETCLLTEDERITIWDTGENQDPFVDFERIAQAQLDKILEALEV